jgi:hypothetical protein
MSRTNNRRLAVLALVTLLATPALHAAGTRPLGPDLGGGILLEGWNLLQGVWGWVVGEEKGGAEIDPDGPFSPKDLPPLDHGCGIDPNGRPLCEPVRATTDSDLGPEIDPNGKP